MCRLVDRYNGGYGSSFTASMIEWVLATRNLSFFPDPTQQSLLIRFLQNGQDWMIVGDRGGRWDASVIGRQIARPANQRVQFRNSISALATLFPDNAALGTLAQRLLDAGPAYRRRHTEFRSFWKADYAVFRGAFGFATLKTFSMRTLNTECIANENRKGRHLGASTLWIYPPQEGGLYETAWPLLDWTRLPGTTTVDNADTRCWELPHDNSTYPPSNVSCWVDGAVTDASGERAFVGSVVFRQSGASAFDFATPRMWSGQIVYKKSFHFLAVDDVARDGAHNAHASGIIVMLGAGIQPQNRSEGVVTGLLQHPVALNTTMPVIKRSLNHTSFFDSTIGVGCVLPKVVGAEAALGLSIKRVAANWDSIGVSNLPASGDMFLATLDHNSTGLAAIYVLGTRKEAYERVAARVRIVRHDTQAQVIFLDGQLVSAVLFAPGEVQLPPTPGVSNVTLTVSEACVMLIDLSHGKGAVSDPTHQLSSIVIDISSGSTATVSLPQGERAGSSATFSF